MMGGKVTDWLGKAEDFFGGAKDGIEDILEGIDNTSIKTENKVKVDSSVFLLVVVAVIGLIIVKKVKR